MTPMRDWGDVTADDDVALLLRFASGARCTVDLSSVTRPGSIRLEAYGGDGALLMLEDTDLQAATGKGAFAPIEIPSRLVRSVEGDPRLAPFIELAERVLARVRGDAGPGDFADFRQGLRVQAILNAAHESADTGRAVRVEAPTT